MKVGDLVRSTVSLTNECQSGIVVRLDRDSSSVLISFRGEGAMILWDHGETCWSPQEELEVISESR